MMTDEEIDAVAKERMYVRRNSDKSRRFVFDYERKGVCGELALYEFFGSDRKPVGNLIYGDDGIDFDLMLLNRENRLPEQYTIDVKCAANPTYLWVQKPRAGIYVLARYNEQTRRAKCIKWQWAEVVRAAPWTIDANNVGHHEIPAGRCIQMDELMARFMFKRCWCGANGNFGTDVDMRNNKIGRWQCLKHWREKDFGPEVTGDQFSLL